MGHTKSSRNSTEKEKGKVVRTTIESRKEIITKFENGVRVSDLATRLPMYPAVLTQTVLTDLNSYCVSSL